MKKQTIDEKGYYSRIKRLNIEHYSGEVPYYTKAPMRKVENKILSLLNKESKILDLGCGSGRFSIGAARFDLNVTGMDITPDAVRAATEKAASLGLINVNFVIGDMTEIPFEDNTFDYVFCPRFSINAVATFKKRKMAINEMLRVVKPGGIVHVESFNKLYIGKGLIMPIRNIVVDLWRTIVMTVCIIVRKEYSGLALGDIVYESNKTKGASIGYAHLPTIFELRRLIPKQISYKTFSITQILGKKFDFFKYFRYSIWIFIKKPRFDK